MIDKVGPDSVDFNVPTRPALFLVFDEPEFISRMDLRWIGRGIPRQEVHWIGGLLGQLSDAQIRDAFRAGGYEGAELDGFTAAFEARVAQLKQL
jgi:hypothetical protein